MVKATLDLYSQVVDLINTGFSTTDISKHLGKSNPTILKLIRFKNEEHIIKKLTYNNNSSRVKGLRKTYGHAKGKTYEEIYGDRADAMKEKRSNWLKENNIRPIGNTYEEMFGKELADYLRDKRSARLKENNIRPEGCTYEEMFGEEIAEELRKKRSAWLSANNNYVRSFIQKISKPQLQLYNIVKKYYANAELEYYICKGDGKYIWLDIAIPDKKINIEYDGLYWHNKELDKERDRFLQQQGWKVYRIQSYKNLTENQLKIEYSKLELIHD